METVPAEATAVVIAVDTEEMVGLVVSGLLEIGLAAVPL